MPKVPEYNNFIEKSPVPDTPQPYQRPYAPPSAFGATEGAVLADLGNRVQHVGQMGLAVAFEEQEKHDKAFAAEAFVTFEDRLGERQEHYLSLKKKDALGVPDKAKVDVEDIYTDISGTLENDRQHELFQAMAQPKRSVFLNAMSRHKAVQEEQFQKDSYAALVTNAVEYGKDNYADPDAIRQAELQIDVGVNALTEGDSAEVTKTLKAERLSDMYTGIVDRRMVVNASDAREYYEKHGDKILGSAKAGIEAKLKAQGVKQQSQTAADDIWDHPAWTYEEKLEQARSISDPDVRDATVTRIKNRHQEEKLIEAETQQNFIDNATSQIINDGTLSGGYEIADTAEKGSVRLKLRQLAQSEHDRRTKDVITNPSKMLEARDKIDHGEIKSENQLMLNYKPHASRKDWDKLNKYYKQGGVIGDLKDSTLRTMYKSLAGKDASKRPEEYQRAWDYVLRQIKATGKQPTDQVVRGWMVEALMEGEEMSGHWYLPDDNMTYAEAVERGVVDKWLPDVSDSERKKIKAILREHGLKDHDENVRRYKKHEIMGIPR